MKHSCSSKNWAKSTMTTISWTRSRPASWQSSRWRSSTFGSTWSAYSWGSKLSCSATFCSASRLTTLALSSGRASSHYPCQCSRRILTICRAASSTWVSFSRQSCCSCSSLHALRASCTSIKLSMWSNGIVRAVKIILRTQYLLCASTKFGILFSVFSICVAFLSSSPMPDAYAPDGLSEDYPRKKEKI